MTHRTRTICVLLLVFSALFMTAGCGMHGEYDTIARQEDKACLIPKKLTTVSPPLGTYVDQGISIDYDKLAPRPNPRENVDMDYVKQVQNHAPSVEQVYYDASQGHERARWLVCVYEVGARFTGREAARYLTSFTCQALVNCKVELKDLPFSEDTASGLRLLRVIGEAFEAKARIEGLKQNLISNVLTLFIGVKASSALRTAKTASPGAASPKPGTTSPRPPERVAKQPYNPHKQRAELEAAHPGKVTSNTVLDAKHRSIKAPEQKRTPGKPARDIRGYLIFDDVAIYDTRLPREAWAGKSSGAHMRAATRDLRRAIDAGEVRASRFTPEQQKAIKSGDSKIPGYTWHHHQDPGRMQLVPEVHHLGAGHVGGAKLWGKKKRTKKTTSP